MPDLERRPCEKCGMLYAPNNARQRFCSAACRGKARKARRRGGPPAMTYEDDLGEEGSRCVKIPYRTVRAAKTAGRRSRRHGSKVCGVHRCDEGCPPGTWHLTSKPGAIAL